MRNGFARQVVPESRVDFSGPTPVDVETRRPIAELRSRVESRRVVLDQIVTAATAGNVPETLRLAGRLSALQLGFDPDALFSEAS